MSLVPLLVSFAVMLLTITEQQQQKKEKKTDGKSSWGQSIYCAGSCLQLFSVAAASLSFNVSHLRPFADTPPPPPLTLTGLCILGQNFHSFLLVSFFPPSPHLSFRRLLTLLALLFARQLSLFFLFLAGCCFCSISSLFLLFVVVLLLLTPTHTHTHRLCPSCVLNGRRRRRTVVASLVDSAIFSIFFIFSCSVLVPLIAAICHCCRVVDFHGWQLTKEKK